jgi:tetratricopeptide (TPR) repeat protein
VDPEPFSAPQTLDRSPSSGRTADAERVGAAEIARGNALRDSGQAEGALEAYRNAIALLEPLERAAPNHPRLRDTLASAWTNQGMAWRTTESVDAGERALDCYARAIALREPLLETGDPWFRFNLAGVLIHRGDVLLEAPGPRAAGEALASYDRALDVMAPLQIEAHPAFRRRRALALVHRANALLAEGCPERRRDALASLDEALRVLTSGPEDPGDRALGGAAWANKAEALAREGSWSGAEAAAGRAADAVATPSGPEEAAVAVKARLTLSLCAVRRPGAGEDGAGPAAAIEHAEDGLRIAAQWNADVRIARAIPDLFALAADTYARHQPQFVGEFLDEYRALASLASPSRAREVGARAIAASIGCVAGRALQARDAAERESLLETFRDLRRRAEALSLPVEPVPARR